MSGFSLAGDVSKVLNQASSSFGSRLSSLGSSSNSCNPALFEDGGEPARLPRRFSYLPFVMDMLAHPRRSALRKKKHTPSACPTRRLRRSGSGPALSPWGLRSLRLRFARGICSQSPHRTWDISPPPGKAFSGMRAFSQRYFLISSLFFQPSLNIVAACSGKE